MNLDWPDCRNVRDLGGLPTSSGGRIRQGALIRADNLQHLTTDGVEAVRRAGVGRILDLRTDSEISRFPTPFTDDPRSMWSPVQSAADPPADEATLAKACIGMLGRRPELFAAAIRAIAEAPEGRVVVHCHSGKDRTGMVIALAWPPQTYLRRRSSRTTSAPGNASGHGWPNSSPPNRTRRCIPR